MTPKPVPFPTRPHTSAHTPYTPEGMRPERLRMRSGIGRGNGAAAREFRESWGADKEAAAADEFGCGHPKSAHLRTPQRVRVLGRQTRRRRSLRVRPWISMAVPVRSKGGTWRGNSAPVPWRRRPREKAAAKRTRIIRSRIVTRRSRRRAATRATQGRKNLDATGKRPSASSPKLVTNREFALLYHASGKQNRVGE